jgi:hypothetical protein
VRSRSRNRRSRWAEIRSAQFLAIQLGQRSAHPCKQAVSCAARAVNRLCVGLDGWRDSPRHRSGASATAHHPRAKAPRWAGRMRVAVRSVLRVDRRAGVSTIAIAVADGAIWSMDDYLHPLTLRLLTRALDSLPLSVGSRPNPLSTFLSGRPAVTMAYYMDVTLPAHLTGPPP